MNLIVHAAVRYSISQLHHRREVVGDEIAEFCIVGGAVILSCMVESIHVI